MLACYRNALQQHLASEFQVRPEQAEEWLQSVVERKVLEYQLMQHADRDRGRFRTFLLNAFGLLMSLNMLIETPGGFDYTDRDCQGWMRAAGFRHTRVQHPVGPDSMAIGIK